MMSKMLLHNKICAQLCLFVFSFFSKIKCQHPFSLLIPHSCRTSKQINCILLTLSFCFYLPYESLDGKSLNAQFLCFIDLSLCFSPWGIGAYYVEKEKKFLLSTWFRFYCTIHKCIQLSKMINKVPGFLRIHHRDISVHFLLLGH